MEFDKSRVYTAVNADELQIGSRCIFADTMDELKIKLRNVEDYVDTLDVVCSDREAERFCSRNATYFLAYLIEPPDEPKYKPFERIDKAMEAIKKHGGWIKKKSNGYQYIVIAKSFASLRLFDGWFTFEEIFYDYVFADDDSPCGELERA